MVRQKSYAVEDASTGEPQSAAALLHQTEQQNDQHDPKMQCGIGSWRPSWLAGAGNIKAFTFTLSMWSLFGSVNFTYFSAVITQIERAFGLPSSMIGFIKNVDNIGVLATVLLFSHFCRDANKPKLFAIVTVMSSSAIALFAVPHFIYGNANAENNIELYHNSSTGNASSSPATNVEYCDGKTETVSTQFCPNSNIQVLNIGALAIFIMSEFLQGVAQAPKFPLTMTFLDDNAKDDSPKHFSFMFSMRAFCPVLGFMLGAWTTTLYVDLTHPDFDQNDPRWVGCWWLGFIICALVSVIWAVPMSLFPAKLKDKDNKIIDTQQHNKEGATLRDLPKAILRCFKNKLFMLMILAISFEIQLMGTFTFLPKYLQQYFGISASMSSVLTGTMGSMAHALGPLLGALIISCRGKEKLTPYFCLKIILATTCLTVCGYVGMMNLTCPEDQWAGQLDQDNPNLTLACNAGCACDSQAYIPICDTETNINYYSPCHAGCSHLENNNGTKVYVGCSCTALGNATMGMCPKKCDSLIPYAAMLFFTMLVGGIDRIPTMTIFLRCVGHQDKALSIALVGAILQVVSFPAPTFFGMIIDSACLVVQGSCGGSRSRGGRSGACLLYDNEAFRWKMHGFTLLFKSLGALCYIAALFVSRSHAFDSTNQTAKVEDAENKDDKGGKTGSNGHVELDTIPISNTAVTGKEVVIGRRLSNLSNNSDV